MEHKFDNYQLSCFLTLLNKVITNCQSEMNLEANIKIFTEYFTGVNAKASGLVSGMESFSLEQSKQIINYMSQGYV